LHDIIVEPLPEHDSFGDDGLIQGIQMAQRIYAQLAFSTFNLGEGTEFFDTYHHFRLWESTLGNAGIKFDSGAYPQKDLRTTVYYDRTISNLLGNVVTHAATDCDTVYIRTFEECVDNQEYLVLAIENNGSRTLDPQEVYEKALNFNLVDPEKELTDEEKLQLIFERGYSTTHGEAVDYGEGSGKGLNIARRLAIQHGGKLVVKSPIDKDKSVGFYLYIPKDKIISE